MIYAGFVVAVLGGIWTFAGVKHALAQPWNSLRWVPVLVFTAVMFGGMTMMVSA